MRKVWIMALILCLMVTLAACGKSASQERSEQELTDTQVQDLFARATEEIIDLAAEEPLTLVHARVEDIIETTGVEKEINGVGYYETTAQYGKIANYYGELFTGEALAWVLGTKFADIDGVLYCSPIGGASGWSLTDITAKNVGIESETFTYEVTYCRIDNSGKYEPESCELVVEKTENGYRVASIGYVPDLLA